MTLRSLPAVLLLVVGSAGAAEAVSSAHDQAPVLRTGCADVVDSAGAAEAVSFAHDLAPVLRISCAVCHLTGEEPGNMKLYPGAAYASLVNAASTESKLKRVQPGAPELSYLMHKLEGTHLDAGGVGEQMPLGQAPLDQAILERFRAWIAQGAQNN